MYYLHPLEKHVVAIVMTVVALTAIYSCQTKPTRDQWVAQCESRKLATPELTEAAAKRCAAVGLVFYPEVKS